MKRKYLLVTLGLALAAGAAWLGRVTWRAHQQFVSLDVRNAPLAEVLHKIERQTWKKIVAEKALDARITLHVKNKPLADVLDRLAEQAGARWSTVYAVYESADALRSLDAGFQGESQLESVGWTKIAPKPPLEDPLGRDVDAPRLMEGPDGMPSELPGKGRGLMMVRKMPNGQIFVQAGNKSAVESWSPEELVVETRLMAAIGDLGIQTASAAVAEEAARKLQAKWTSYVALRKSILGVGFAPPPREGGGIGPDPLRRNPNDRFARLTPEQRVLQARQRLQLTNDNSLEPRMNTDEH